MTASPLLNQINDRKFLLPSDYESKYNIDFRRERPKSYFNTAQRVFTEYVLTSGNTITDSFDFNNENTNPNYKKTVKRLDKRNNDSVGNLLAYIYAPDFRDQVKLSLIFN